MKLTIKLSILSSINIIITFLYQWYVVVLFGPGSETDALFAGMVIPQLFLAIITGSLMYVLIPILSIEKQSQFSIICWTFFQLTGLIFLAISLILSYFADYWVPFFVPGFDNATTNLSISLIRIQLIGMIFIALTTVLWSASHAKKKFVFVECTTIISNIIGFLFLVTTIDKFGIFSASWAMVIKSALQTLLLINIMGTFSLPQFNHSSVKNFFTRIKPLIAGTIYYKSEQLFDRFLASMTNTGNLTLLHLSQQIYSVSNMLFDKAILSPTFPELSKNAFNNKWNEFTQIINKRFIIIIILTILAYICLFFFGKPVLSLIFVNFSKTDINKLWILLLCLIGLLMGAPLGQLLSSSFYAQGNTITPTKIGVVGYTLGIVCKITGFYYYGITGVAIGTTIFYFFNIFIMTIFLSKAIHLNEKKKPNNA